MDRRERKKQKPSDESENSLEALGIPARRTSDLWASEDHAPPVDRKLLKEYLRLKLSDHDMERVEGLILRFRSWDYAHDELMDKTVDRDVLKAYMREDLSKRNMERISDLIDRSRAWDDAHDDIIDEMVMEDAGLCPKAPSPKDPR